MASIDDERGRAAPRQRPGGSGAGAARSDLEGLVDKITFDGNLAALIAVACDKASGDEPPSPADPRHAPDPGVQAAIQAYTNWKRTKEGSMDMEVRLHPSSIEPPAVEPEILPLSLAGQWVAWSSDGMRIVASAETIDEAERLAAEAGEPDPIFERHPGRARL